MKLRLPYVISFEDLQKQYSEADIYELQHFYSGMEKLGYKVDKSSPMYTQSARGIGEEKLQKVLETLSKFRVELEELEEKMLDFVQFQVLNNPPVYIARTRDIKTDKEYFTGKTFFPVKGGKKKEVKIYVGKAEDFNNDTRNKNALNIARIKMRDTLMRRLEEGSL